MDSCFDRPPHVRRTCSVTGRMLFSGLVCPECRRVPDQVEQQWVPCSASRRKSA